MCHGLPLDVGNRHKSQSPARLDARIGVGQTEAAERLERCHEKERRPARRAIFVGEARLDFVNKQKLEVMTGCS